MEEEKRKKEGKEREGKEENDKGVFCSKRSDTSV